MKLKLTKPLAFFDLETTGLDVVKDRIVEICILKVNPDGNEEIFTSLINPEIPIPQFTSAIHGIYDKDVKDAPKFYEIAKRIYDFIHNCDLAGFNSNKFDIPLLAEEFYRAKHTKGAEIEFDIDGRKFIDIQNIFHRMEPRNLKAAYKFYCEKEHDNAHSAEADIKATYEILKAQLDKYENVEYTDNNGKTIVPIKNDVFALSEFSFHKKTADLSGHIGYNEKGEEIFNFGKYKSKTLLEIFEKEPQYFDWMIKADFPYYTKEVIEKIITRLKLEKLVKSKSTK